MKPIVDTILGWTISKKLSILIVGTVMVYTIGDISDNWLVLAGVYLGVQGLIDLKSK